MLIHAVDFGLSLTGFALEAFLSTTVYGEDTQRILPCPNTKSPKLPRVLTEARAQFYSSPAFIQIFSFLENALSANPRTLGN